MSEYDRYKSDSEVEAEGRPDWFRRSGYLATDKDKLRYSQKVIAREHLQNALQAGASGEVLSEIVKAVKALEK